MAPLQPRCCSTSLSDHVLEFQLFRVAYRPRRGPTTSSVSMNQSERGCHRPVGLPGHDVTSAFDFLQDIRAAGVSCPLLCKEFIVEAYQLYKARAYAHLYIYYFLALDHHVCPPILLQAPLFAQTAAATLCRSNCCTCRPLAPLAGLQSRMPTAAYVGQLAILRSISEQRLRDVDVSPQCHVDSAC